MPRFEVIESVKGRLLHTATVSTLSQMRPVFPSGFKQALIPKVQSHRIRCSQWNKLPSIGPASHHDPQHVLSTRFVCLAHLCLARKAHLADSEAPTACCIAEFGIINRVTYGVNVLAAVGHLTTNSIRGGNLYVRKNGTEFALLLVYGISERGCYEDFGG